MLAIILTFQAAQTESKQAQPATPASSQTTSSQSASKEQKTYYAGGFYVYLVKGTTKTEYKLSTDKNFDPEAFKKEVSTAKGVKDVKYDEKNKTFTVTVDNDAEVVKTIEKYGFAKVEKKSKATETKKESK